MNLRTSTLPASHGWGLKMFVGIGLALSTIVTTGATVGLGYIADTWKEQRIERVRQVNEFATEAARYDTRVAEFMSPFLAEEGDDKQRANLRAYLLQQHGALENVEGLLSGTELQQARKLREEFVLAVTELDKRQEIKNARPLAQALLTARDTQMDVLVSLKRKVGLPYAVG